jgi:hypothetical protein
MDDNPPLIFTRRWFANRSAHPDWLWPAGGQVYPRLKLPLGTRSRYDIISKAVRRSMNIMGSVSSNASSPKWRCASGALLSCRSLAAKEAISKALVGIHGVGWRKWRRTVAQWSSDRNIARKRKRTRNCSASAFDVSIADLQEFRLPLAVAIQTFSSS